MLSAEWLSHMQVSKVQFLGVTCATGNILGAAVETAGDESSPAKFLLHVGQREKINISGATPE